MDSDGKPEPRLVDRGAGHRPIHMEGFFLVLFIILGPYFTTHTVKCFVFLLSVTQQHFHKASVISKK